MNVQTQITSAVRLRFELPQPVDVEPPAWPPELPRASIELRPSRSRRRPTPRAVAVPPLSARARGVLIRYLPPSGRRSANPVFYDEQRLLRIAARCTRTDLLAQRGVGPVIVHEIQVWLTAHGKQFSRGPALPPTALAQAITLIEAMLEGLNPDAFLEAFVALPELRRSLDAQTARR